MEKALLVGVNLKNGEPFRQSMEELAALSEACDMEVVAVVTQVLPLVNKALYIGPGKVEEVRELAEANGAQVIVFDNALSPSQLRNLQKEIGLPILDRTTLILEIFSTRAKTREAKLQVEVAKLQYMLPRLVGLHEALSRQGGGSGLSNKGSGEKKLELDRRKIEHRLSELRKELEEVSKERETQRKRRAKNGEKITGTSAKELTTKTCGETTEITIPKREGYTFNGWEVSGATVSGNQLTMGSADATITATYKQANNFEDDTWAEIAANVANSTALTRYKVGATRDVTLVRLLQRRKASSPIEVTLSGITTLVRLLH